MHTTETTNRLVCGLDDSELAPAVANVAVELAARLGLRLCVVHSAHHDQYPIGWQAERLLDRGTELLDGLIPSDVPHERVVELGDPANLLRSVLARGADLAVVGTRGLGPVRAAIVGSVSNAVVGAARCPVVVVPPHNSVQLDSGTPAVVCGIDRSTGPSNALMTAAKLAGALGSELVAVHDGVPEDVVQRAVDEFDTELPVRVRSEVGDPAKRLTKAAADEPAAILVVGSRGHGPLRSALSRSVSSRLCASAPVPVVVVRDAARGAQPDTERVGAATSAG